MAAQPNATPASQGHADEIGEDGKIVRAFNFSGGGFNTVMQLGVTHALLVAQGKPPDIVVGVSAGSIPATALADVMRKGAVVATSSKKDYEDALAARVGRFREVVEVCHCAPEDLIDALLPDAYQIDSFDPLKPLEQPTLKAAERAERRGWLSRKAGLARLYNALLGLDIPIGVAARMIRRALGFRAVGNIDIAKGFGLAKLVAIVTELMKSWLLLTQNLRRFAPLVSLLVWPMLASLHQSRRSHVHLDAETITFRFSVVDRINATIKSALSFLFLLNSWALVTFGVLLLPFVAIALQKAGSGKVSNGWLVLAVLYGLLYLSPLVPSAVRRDRAAFWRASKDLCKGLAVFLFHVVRWTLLMLALTALPVLAIAVVARNVPEGTLSLYAAFTLIVVFFVGALLGIASLFAGVVYLFRRTQWWRRMLVEASRRSTIMLVSALIVVLILVATFGGDEGLPRVLRAVGLMPTLQSWLDAFSVSPTDRSLGGLEDLARSAGPPGLTWSQRALLDICIALWVVIVSLLAALILVGVTAIWIGASYAARSDRSGSWFGRRFLERFDIGSSISHSYPLKKLLVQLFDRDYYGTVSLVVAANDAFADPTRLSRNCRPHLKRVIADYSVAERPGQPRIRLAFAVANLGTGKLDVIDEGESIVDALLAANAIPPIFPPVKLGHAWYADAIHVGNVPTRALLRLLRKHPTARISGIHIYAVNPLPVSQDELSPPIDAKGKQKDTPYLNLIDIAQRALQLERYRDAKIERRLTSIFTDALPHDEVVREVQPSKPQADEAVRPAKKYFRMFVAPVELDRPISLNNRILFAPKEDRREEFGRTIAMGCRAALQVMLAETLATADATTAAHGPAGKQFISCQKAVDLYKMRNGGDSGIKVPGAADGAPGLAEICKHCAIRDDTGRVLAVDDNGVKIKAERSLRLLGSVIPAEIMDWPQERQWDGKERAEAPNLSRIPIQAGEQVEGEPGKVCLFGGGVFRGVFQMGVLSALALTDFKPTIAAGASVGSITAAMSLAVLTKARKQRLEHVAELASIYLAMDRLVLTDRFSDFIRTWTIRASEARFSIRQADRIFRKYDFDAAPVFQRTAREVVAGLERLFYVSPYQLNEIVAAARHREAHKLVGLLKARAQAWLDRMSVGTEVLGAEPLRLMIDEFVVARLKGTERMLLKDLGGDACLLATSTNLTRGALRILGSAQDAEQNRGEITLVEALLASSAFPGVFRPRRSGDLLPGASTDDEYVDGGIVDNFPLDPVLQELRAQAKSGKVGIRPKTPHLVLAASLEPRYSELPADSPAFSGAWCDLQTRMRELQYNVKLDMYETGLRDVSDIFESLSDEEKQLVRPPLNVKLIAIKPEWLCDTFAFHPMLGFRRVQQAKSIAHGCATTLCSLSAVKARAKEWGLEPKHIPDVSSPSDVPAKTKRSRKKAFAAGMCWLNEDLPCPFSRQATAGSLLTNSRARVAEIHRHCWDPATHQRDGANRTG